MLVLASASPRRQELLRNAGIPFEVRPTEIAEDPLPGEGAKECAERLAREKALAVSRQRPHDVVLGADTVVVIDNVILGKPADRGDAARMLRMLSGREHQVITGVCLVLSGQWSVARTEGQKGDPQGLKPSFLVGLGGTAEAVPSPEPILVTTSSETTVVTMAKISEEEIADYVATREPMDKAGAYAIQGIASRWIPRIEGDYSNVVGLPVALVWRMLQQAGGG
jgi:septum formation protein